jgi:periplasmic mercuric ion binding protein
MMKKIILIVSLLLSSFALAGEELKVNVKGMVCAFCAQGIEKNFKKQPEVDKIKVSLENKFVLITFKDGKRIPNEKIAAMLKDAGYESSIGENK